MIGVLVFFVHLAGIVYAFSRNYHEHKLIDALMAVAFFLIIFSVGWTIAGFIVHFTVPAKGLGPIDSDSISLLIVTFLEAVLYLVYFKGKKKEVSA
jgi:hypothetical protein